MKKYILSFAILSLLIASCSTEPKEAESSEQVAPVCHYSYNDGNTQFGWIAYKTSDKVAVKGSFNTITVSDIRSSQTDPLKVLESAHFNIPIATVNSQNPERDEKITNNFFGTMVGTSAITGTVVSLKDNVAKVSIKMNDIEKEITGAYTLTEDGAFSLTASIDLLDFNGQDAIASLNKICGVLHAGADGVSKLWSQVDLTFETVFEKTCE